ncbi:hypothetical protein FPOA_13136 [Fusarium poae]|uniref:Nucleoside phosphorylase domain-containing protein n=2 Tax=Fusarium poae TaxID=36050 RepID=A0A1B8A6Q6_FUSPO|nr:hypothetical protein FPOA_13136 [Fusarium poae]
MSNPDDVTIGYICTDVPTLTSCRISLDQEQRPSFGQLPRDDNTYTIGKIGSFLVASCVGLGDATSTAICATHMRRTFPNIKLLFLLSSKAGIVPHDSGSGRVGDVLVPHSLLMRDQDGNSRTVDLTKILIQDLSCGLNESIENLISRNEKWGRKCQRPTADHVDGLSKVFVQKAGCSIYPDGAVISMGDCPEDADYRDDVAASFNTRSIVCFDDGHTSSLLRQMGDNDLSVVPILGISHYCDERTTSSQRIWKNYASVAVAACARMVLEQDNLSSFGHSRQTSHTSKADVNGNTLTDSSIDCGSIATPSSITATCTLPQGDERSVDTTSQQISALEHPIRPPPSPEPTVILAEIQNAAQNVSQLAGRFGFKMIATLQRPRIKTALFKDQKKLQLSSLRYADNFNCRVTKRFGKPGSFSTVSAPALWWLWDPLLEWLGPSYRSTDYTLEFTPISKRADIDLSYGIKIRLCVEENEYLIELTATFGGIFREQRIFKAPVTIFQFPKLTCFGVSKPALDVDERPYKGEGSFKDTFDYLMPAYGNLWRSAMGDSPAEEILLVEALSNTCKAEDDYMYMSKDQDCQCQNLVLRFSPAAREFVTERGLVGRKGGAYSKAANGPPGPKD